MNAFYKAFIFVGCAPTLSAHISIRIAQPADLPKILKLERTITYEYLIPTIYEYYQTILNYETLIQNFETELEDLESQYLAAINGHNNYLLYVAYDHDTRRINGFCYAYKEQTTLKILKTIVYKEWENTQLPLEIIKTSMNHFKEITQWTACPFICDIKSQNWYRQLELVNNAFTIELTNYSRALFFLKMR